ncbi:helix-turn-helix transcriptional regulator [Paenibacillus flagellatus]|uniref:YafY family transcriptional regulator n=1 Tax=Paenibacillus flagellatus TaxID=2211139 RepID=A0A2V5K172_9BACL|nr:YafY family protein [Paenibacillus flagellatus]PYI52955.1 YafY family transcriptional regulator [Paenibacillus flagellatus]
MNKTDRMLAVVLELQRKGTLRAVDLAETFETSVRTIYRDVQALCEAGVPIVGSPGQGYSLVEGYFLPPISFTADEAVTLLLGLDFVEQRYDEAYRAKAAASRGKIEAILPDPVRREAARTREGWRLIAAGAPADARDRDLLEPLRRAVAEERVVRFRYTKPRPGADGESRESEREAEPYGLVHAGGHWMLVARCRMRGGIRHFRLSRIDGLALTEERFRRPADFNLHDYKPDDDRRIEVKVAFPADMAPRLRETGSFYMESMETSSGGVLVTLRVRQPEDVLHWVLGWGAKAVVLEPEALREAVREQIESMRKSY